MYDTAYDIETENCYAIVVAQAVRERAADLLRANGYHIADQGWSDGSTSWTIVLASDATLEAGASEATANAAQELLWDNGIGWVATTMVPVVR